MKIGAFWLTIILCGQSALVIGDEIHLTTGKVIHTNRITEKNGTISYEVHGGSVSFPASMVREIIYGKTIPEPSTPATAPTKDISEQLLKTLFTESAIDKASLATVSIKTEAGYGSGFFISDNGYILTNRHVVRGDKKDRKEIDEEINKRQEIISKEARELDRQYKLIMAESRHRRLATSFVRSQNRRNYGVPDAIRERKLNEASLEVNRRILQNEKADYNDRKKKFIEEKSKFDDWKDEVLDARYKLTLQDEFEITLADKSTYQAILHAISSKHDLALLKIQGSITPYLDYGNAEIASRGLPVYAIGSPIKPEYHNTVTSGIVSGFHDGFIVTSAQTYPGNSGGPLVSREGKVIGIITLGVSLSKETPAGALGFALPIGAALTEFNRYLKKL